MLNYDLYSYLQQINVITENGSVNNNYKRVLNKYDILDDIISYTNFLYPSEYVSLLERLYVILQEYAYQPLCQTCQQPVRYNKDRKRFNYHCSKQCSARDQRVVEKRNNTIEQQYGKHRQLIRQKAKQTNIERYGTTTPLSNSHVRQKIKQTNIERYGVENGSSGDAVRGRKEQTNLYRYGVKYPSQHPNVRAKISNNHARKNTDQELNDPDLLRQMHYDQQMNLAQIADSYSVSPHLVSTRFKHFNINVQDQYQSLPQQQIYQFIKSLTNTQVLCNQPILSNRQHVDILLPHFNLAIEVDGIFWHSQLQGKDKFYHLRKTNDFEQNFGGQLIHIWDKEWFDSPEVVKSKLRSCIGNMQQIYARLCHVDHVGTQTCSDFCNTYHLSGNANSSVKYGLFYGQQLVSVMTFCKSRFDNHNQYELLRYCTKPNIYVVGGASKLLAAFINNHTVDDLITFADRRWSTGNVYKQLGFEYQHATAPNYWYYHRNSKPTRLFHRVTFQKHKLPNKLEHFDSNLTEWQNMVNNGYDRIWDCGNHKWMIRK